MFFAKKVTAFFLIAAVSALAEVTSHGSIRRAKAVEIEDVKFFWELNDTDQDLGVQLVLGAPKAYKTLKMTFPNGNDMVNIKVAGTLLKQGLSDFFYESGEPNFDKVSKKTILKRFPAGVYRFSGITIDDKPLTGKVTLTKNFPPAPKITSPIDGAKNVPANEDLVVKWTPFTTQQKQGLDSFEVIVTNEDDTSFKIDMRLGPDASSATISKDFLQKGTLYEIEVLSREKSGNQVISIIFFETKDHQEH